jgi:hypothetical protein
VKARNARIDVTADKPGRWVGVEIAQGERDGDHHPWKVSLSIERDAAVGSDPWTWLAPDEARLVAAALIQAADRADALRARDPRDG